MMDDDEAASSDESLPGNTDEKSDETEDQLALVPMSFFSSKGNPKPGMRETVEVVNVYENEVSIKCVYDDEDKEEKSEGETSEAAPAEAESDSMMS